MRTYRNDDLRRTHTSSRRIASHAASHSSAHASGPHASSNRVSDVPSSSTSHLQKHHFGTRGVGHHLDALEKVESTRNHRVSNKVFDAPKRTIRTLMPVRRTSTSNSSGPESMDDPCDVVDVAEANSRLRGPSPRTENDVVQVEVKRKKSQNVSPLFPHNRVSHTKSLRMVRRRHMSDFHMEPLMKKRKSADGDEGCQGTVAAPSGVAGTAVHREQRHTRADSSRRDELINCTCGFAEEDGLMIQCDLCLCWQHGLCNNIEHEDDVPDKYICIMCQHPLRERRSMHFLRDQDWLKEGRLPTLKFRSKSSTQLSQRAVALKRVHDLIGLLLQFRRFIHSLRVKVNIAETPDHPKLYLWNQSWEKPNGFQSEENVGESSPHGIEPLLSEVEEDLKDENLLLNKCDLSVLDNSPKQLDLEMSTSTNSACLNNDANSTDCQSMDIDRDASDFCSNRDNDNLLADICDNKDPFCSEDSIYSCKDDDIQLELPQPEMETEDTLPDLSQDLMLDSPMNEQNDSEIEPGKIIENGDLDSSDFLLNEKQAKNTEDETTFPNLDEPLKSIQPTKESGTSKDLEQIQENELEIPFCQKDLLNLASSIASKLESLDESDDGEGNEIPLQRIPQPEVPIDLTECRLTLLDHIEIFQVQLELHLTTLETQISGLEGSDPYLVHDERTDHQTKETVQMLLHDLSLVNDVAALN